MIQAYGQSRKITLVPAFAAERLGNMMTQSITVIERLHRVLQEVATRPPVCITLEYMEPNLLYSNFLGYPLVITSQGGPSQVEGVLNAVIGQGKNITTEEDLVRQHYRFSVTLNYHPLSEREKGCFIRHYRDIDHLLGDLIAPLRVVGSPLPSQEWEKDVWRFEDGTETPARLMYRNLIHPLIPIVIERLPLVPNALICDPACGEGYILEKLSEVFPQRFKLMGSDLNSTLASRTAIRLSSKSVQVIQNDAATLSYLDDQSVDLFILSGLINDEVVDREKTEAILERIKQKLKTRGWVVVTGISQSHFNSYAFERAGFKVKRCVMAHSTGVLVPMYVLQLVEPWASSKFVHYLYGANRTVMRVH